MDHDIFLNWAKENFDDISESGDEIKVNSIFAEDTKKHLWCNPNKNVYHCWKTDESGNLYQLVTKVNKCSYQEAIDMFSSDNAIRMLEARLEKFFNEKKQKEKPTIKIDLPKDTFRVDKLIKKDAENYIINRGLDVGNMMFCLSGKYRNRLIIPYYDDKNNLIYWNSRDIHGKSIRYLGPPNEGIGKSDVIYMTSWPKKGEKIYLSEGEFDAMSLSKCGLNGAACGGKNLSEKQIETLKGYKICICFDTDKSGQIALNKIGDKLLKNGIQDVSYVRPPVDEKKMDWNRMLIEFGINVMYGYIIQNEKPFTHWTSNSLRFNYIV